MENFAALLDWANTNGVRLTLKFIPSQAPAVFVIEAQVPRPAAGDNMFEFVRRRGKTVQEVCGKFLEHVR